MNPLIRTASTLTTMTCVLLPKPVWCAEQQSVDPSNGQANAAAPVAAPTVAPGQQATANQSPVAPTSVGMPPAERQNAASSVATSPYGPAKPPSTPAPEPAQQTPKRTYDGPPTLLEDYAIGGFGGVGVMYTRFAGNGAAQVCGEGGVIIDHSLELGGGGCGITTTVDAYARKYGPPPNYPGDRMGFGYGGAIIRYHFLTRKIVNVGVGALIGAGGLTIGAWDSEEDHWADTHQRTEAVFVFEPQVGAYTNFTRWLRMGVTVGYRLVSGVSMQGVSASDLTAPTVGGVIQGGWF